MYVTVAYEEHCWIGCILHSNLMENTVTISFLHPHLKCTIIHLPRSTRYHRCLSNRHSFPCKSHYSYWEKIHPAQKRRTVGTESTSRKQIIIYLCCFDCVCDSLFKYPTLCFTTNNWGQGLLKVFTL